MSYASRKARRLAKKLGVKLVLRPGETPARALRRLQGEFNRQQAQARALQFSARRERMAARGRALIAQQQQKFMPSAVTKKLPNGSITVTDTGRVTTKDKKGNIIRQFTTKDINSARGFIRREAQKQEIKRVAKVSRKTLATPKTTIKKLPQEAKPFFFDPTKPEDIKKMAQLEKAGVIEKQKTGEKVVKEFKPKTVSEKLAVLRGRTISAIKDPKTGTVEKIFKGTAVLGALGAARGIKGVFETIRHPVKTTKEQIEAIKQPRETITVLRQQFFIDPVGTVAEFVAFSRGLGLVGKGVKRNPLARTIQEELFIRAQPVEIRNPVRKIIKSAKVQEKINPIGAKTVSKVDFAEVKSLTKTEARALAKTLAKTDSVLFGSLSARALSKSRTKIPKDVDLATKNVKTFSETFIKELPRSQRKNYSLVREKVVRKTNNEALFDVKPLNRLIPNKSLLTRRGRLPVAGYVTELKPRPGSRIPRATKKLKIGKFDIPTQKLVKIGGIKAIGFGEQTTRKALGTLQVLIEKNIRRAKDPQAFLIGLEIQLDALIKKRPKTRLGKLNNKRKIKVLKDAIKLLKSKAFARLLEKKIPGLTKEFPLVAKIDTKKLKNIKLSLPKTKKISLEGALVSKISKTSVFKKFPTSKGLKRLSGKDLHVTVLSRRQFQSLTPNKKILANKLLSRAPEVSLDSKVYSIIKGRKQSNIILLTNQKAWKNFQNSLIKKLGVKTKEPRIFHVSIANKAGTPLQSIASFTKTNLKPLTKISATTKKVSLNDIRRKTPEAINFLSKQKFYHGTATKNVGSIKKQGIRTDKNFNFVFVSPSYNVAKSFADYGKGSVFEVTLTKNQLKTAAFSDFPTEIVLKRGLNVKPSQLKVLKTKPAKTSFVPVKKRVKARVSSNLPPRLVKRKKLLRPSYIPVSRLQRSRVSKFPVSKASKLKTSRLPKKKVSKLPLSKIPKAPPSKIPISKLPKSKISRIPPSRLTPSVLSRIPISKILPAKLVRIPTSKLPPKLKKKKFEEVKKIVNKESRKKNFIYIPDLVSIFEGISASKLEKKAFLQVGRIFTGLERRKLVK